MRRLPWVVSLAVFALTLPSAPAQLPAPLGQNDAGSGTDAPNAVADALPLAPGVYEGTLAGAASNLGLPATPVDLDDWYRVWIEKGDRVGLSFEGLDVRVPVFDPTYHGFLELRTPGNELATWLGVTAPQMPTTISIIAAETGWWAVHVLTFRVGGLYRFGIELSVPESPGASHAGNGYLLSGVSIGPGGGRFVLDMAIAYIFREGAAAGVSIVEFESTGELHEHMGEMQGSFGLTATATLGDAHVTAQAAHASDATYTRFASSFEENAPGTYYFLVFAKTAETYISFDMTTTGNVTFDGVVERDESSLRARQHRDFTGGVGVSATFGRFSKDLHTEFEVEHRLWGIYTCGPPSVQCTVTRPGGPEQPVVGGATYEHAEPGAWRFTRTNEASTDGDYYLFFGVDYELPEPACKEPKGKHNGEGHGQGHGHGHGKCK